MGVQVAFNYPAWVALFPEFASPGGLTPVTEAQADNYFTMATSVHRNDGGGPVCDPAVQLMLLNYLTAHFAKLLAAPAGSTAAAGLVGRISDAAEGSVHVAVELPANMPTSSAFFTQSTYGFVYWTASAPYRTMRYVANPRNPVNAGAGYAGGYSGGSGWVG